MGDGRFQTLHGAFLDYLKASTRTLFSLLLFTRSFNTLMLLASNFRKAKRKINCFELKTNVTRKVGVNSAGGQELDAGNKSNEERIQYSPYCRVTVFFFFVNCLHFSPL